VASKGFTILTAGAGEGAIGLGLGVAEAVLITTDLATESGDWLAKIDEPHQAMATNAT